MQGFLEKLSPNFFIAAFIPSLGFLLTAVVIFEPILPPTLDSKLALGFDSLTQEPLLFLVLTLILGFTLSTLNTFIYKLLEGYMVLQRIPHIRKSQQNKAKELKKQIAEERRKLNEEENGLTEEEKDTIKDILYTLEALYHASFPPKEHAVLPTRFGNIFRAAETYPADRYGIDSVPIWPRLIHVMPSSYYDKMEQSNNGLAFVINCMLLSLMLACLCIVAGCYQWGILEKSKEEFSFRYSQLATFEPREKAIFDNIEYTYFLPIEVSERAHKIYRERTNIYFVFSILATVIFFAFYFASLPIARQYTNLIKSAYDLFRFDLIKQLNLPLPKDSAEEFDLWKKISEFIVIGNPNNDLRFTYKFVETDSKSTSSEQ